MPEQEIRYIKGIDKDTAYSSYTPDKYFHLQNGKVVTVDGSSTGAIEVENGNKLLFKLPDVLATYKVNGRGRTFTQATVTINGHTEIFNVTSTLELAESIKSIAAFNCNVYITANSFTIYGASTAPVVLLNNGYGDVTKLISPAQTGLKIIGMNELRDDLIVFTTNQTSATPDGYGQIWKLPINKVDGIVTGILAGDYLNDMVHLIYHGKLNFSTYYPITEVTTKVDNALYGKVYFTDGYNVLRQFNAYQENLMGLSPDSFSIVPNSSLSAPVYYETLTGGLYESGIVQYTYRLYNRYGTTTRFAPLSRIIYITDKNEGEQHSTDYYGSPENTATGKAIRVAISIDDFSYDSIQIVSVYQETLYSTPVISVVADQLNISPLIYITDSHRDGAEELNYATLAALGGKEFVTQTLSVKDNFLVAMNNKELSFNPDFDARAYRFKNTGVTYVTLDMSDASHWGVPETADCINPYNDYATYRAGTDEYKYKADGATPGGEGPNVSYIFDNIEFDIEAAADDRNCYADVKGSLTVGGKIYQNGSFLNQASEGLGSIRGWMRNEVYRCGIVFYNKGKVSPVKWIGDIRMPSAYEDNPFDTYGKGSIIVPVFTVNNVPLDEDGNECTYQIVVVPREGQDMTVLANGYLESTRINAADSNYVNPTILPYFGDLGDAGLYRFVCAETNFNKNMSFKQGDIIEFNLRGNTLYYDNVSLSGTSAENTYKLKTLEALTIANPSDRFVDIDDGVVMTVGQSSLKTINGITYRNFISQLIFSGTAYWGYSGTVMVLGATINANMFKKFTVPVDIYTAPYVSYIRPRPSQYGGNTYADRSRNEYVPASDVITASATSTYALYGDVFVGYFDYLSRMNVDPAIMAAGEGSMLEADYLPQESMLEADYLPVESTINVGYRHDIPYSRIGALPLAPAHGAWRLFETVEGGNNVHGTDYYKSVTDLYLYNAVYSRLSNAIKFYPLPFNLPDIKEFDTEIAISEKHLNNQYTDSWCSFLPNNVTYVDGRYGAICKGVNYNNQIHFLQEGGFGLIAVNERVSTVDQTGNTLVLGTGDSLGRYGYISYNTGTTEKTSVVVSGAGLHFFDTNSKKWMVYTQGAPTALSDVKGLIGYFNDFIDNYQSDGHSQLKRRRYGIVAVNDNIHNRVIATFIKTPGLKIFPTPTYATVSYNMFQSAFESFLDCHSPLYATYKNDILMVNPSGLSECWYGQRGNKSTFYGVLYDTYIQLISTLRGPTMIMSTIEYDSVSTDNGTDVYDDTFNFVRFSNSYQDSGTIPVIDEENSRRLMRTWRIWAPRSNDESSVEFNPALDSDARMRDKYTKIELRYNNTNNYRFVFHPVKVSFMANNY